MQCLPIIPTPLLLILLLVPYEKYLVQNVQEIKTYNQKILTTEDTESTEEKQRKTEKNREKQN